MDTTVIVLIVLLLLFVCLCVYASYQGVRNEKVYKIRSKWLNTDQIERFDRYSYGDMFDPNKRNWYGFRYPKDEHYK